MNTELHDPAVYDFRAYDRVWQRVGPQMEPYPTAEMPTPAVSPAAQAAPARLPSGGMTDSPAARQAQLPGAEENPCCMGTAAQESVPVLTGFIEDELADERFYRAMSRQAPSWARQRLRDIAEEEAGHARRLQAVYYLITGECYTPAVTCGHICVDRWCAALRARYHEEACGGLNYARAAEGTTDICLADLLNSLSADEYRHAEILLTMLERSLRS